jgi:hypothetical protein
MHGHLEVRRGLTAIKTITDEFAPFEGDTTALTIYEVLITRV